MEKRPRARSGIALVVIFFLLAIISISAIESVLFYEKFSNIETLEVLHNRMNHISRIVARLGNTLDIVVVGQRFEQITINILRSDVDRIDAEMNKMLKKYTTNRFVLSDKALIAELKSLPEDWLEVHGDMYKFRADMRRDEVMLIHNDIDVDVLILDEKLDRISAAITAKLKAVFSEIKILLLASLAAFILMLTAASIYLYLRFISPMKKLEAAAIAMASGWGGTRFSKRIPGVFGRVAKEMNIIFAGAEQRAEGLESEVAELKESVIDKEKAITALGAFFTEAGRSFDFQTLFSASLDKVLAMTGASVAFVYISEGDKLRLKASAGEDAKDMTPPPIISIDSIDDGSGRPVELSGSKAPSYSATFSSRGATCMRSFIISPGKASDYGRLLMLFTDTPDEDTDGFVRALASAMGTSIAFAQKLREEHDARQNCLMLINQMPMGLAVFEREGSCVMANLLLKRFLGAGPDFDFVRDYMFTEDDLLDSQGLVTTINKAYDGFVTEFIIKYDPHLVKRYGFRGEVRDLRVKSVPLYDPGGRITKIALMYEDITVTDETGRDEDNKRL